jgi:hypothetical protein
MLQRGLEVTMPRRRRLVHQSGGFDSGQRLGLAFFGFF